MAPSARAEGILRTMGLPLVVLALLVPSLGVASGHDGFSYETTIPNGSAVFRVEDPTGFHLEGRAVFEEFTYDTNMPIAIAFISDAGAVDIVPTNLEGQDARTTGIGDNVVYASTGDTHVGSPPLVEWRTGPAFSGLIRGDAEETSGYLLIAWAYQRGTLRFDFWDAPESVTLVSESAQAETFDLHSMSTTVAAGAYPVGHAHMSSTFATDAPGTASSFTFIRYFRGEGAGVGDLDLTSDAATYTLPLTFAYDPLMECICASTGIIAVGSEDEFSASLTYAGEWRTQIFGLTTQFLHPGFPHAPFVHEVRSTGS